ncbi:hypothetical protein [Dankookia sp. P2]
MARAALFSSIAAPPGFVAAMAAAGTVGSACSASQAAATRAR